MSDFSQSIVEQFSAQSGWEMLAVMLALLYVWLAARQNMLCWPCAFVSTAIYVWLFWEHTLPFHTLLNAYYMLMAVYGWWQWRRRTQEEVFSRRLSWQVHATAFIGLSVLSAALGTLAQPAFDTQYIYLDATVTVFSVFTTLLVAHRVWENWHYWIVINCAASWLYWQNGLLLTSMLFVFYVAFSFYGLVNWRKDLQRT